MSNRLVLVCALAALVAVGLWRCLRPAGDDVRCIVIVTVDTLRADHMGAYGYPRDTTPFLDQLAARGVRFERAFAPMSTTAPSHASLFSGLYPTQHEVVKNGYKMPDEVLTFPEILREEGFETAAFVSTGVHFGPGNITQGFDHVDEPDLEKRKYRSARKTIDAAVQWLDEQDGDDPILLWVHLFDPHMPYRPPAPHREAIGSESPEQRQRVFEELVETQAIPVSFDKFGGRRDKLMNIIGRYDAEIHYADAELSRLDHHLSNSPFSSQTMWVVTADHGEGLGAHDWFGHGREIYNEQIRVPLIVRFPNERGAGTTVDEVVEMIDVMPSILERVAPSRLEDPQPWPATSLLPLIDGERDAWSQQYAFTQRRRYASQFDDDDDDGDDDSRQRSHKTEPGEKYSLQNDRYKYIHRTEGPDELYAIGQDPYETQNLIGQEHPQETALRAKLLEFVDRFGHRVPVQKTDEETIEKLRSLGYVR